MLVAVMVVALNPPRSSAPTAISATTLPSVVVRVQNPARDDAPKDATPGIVRIAGNAVSRGEGLALTGAPNAVSAAHLADEYALADDLPDDDERIMLLTSTATFVMLWGEIDQISYAPDDTLVITHSRELVAVFVDGDLRLLVR